MNILATPSSMSSLYKPLQWLASRPLAAPGSPPDCLYPLDVVEDKSEEKQLLDKLVQVPNLSPAAGQVLKRDLAAFPVPLLRLLAADDLLVIGMQAGQTLADTPRLVTVQPDVYHGHVEQAHQILDECLTRQGDQKRQRIEERVQAGEPRDYVEAMENHWWAKGLQEDLSARLVEAGIGFAVEMQREPLSVDKLAGSRNVESDNLASWKETFHALNAELVEFQGDQATPRQGIVLIPYAYYRGRAVSEVTLKQALDFKAQRAKDAMGIHNHEERMITLYEDYLFDPAPEAGHHRVAIHETGHALDHALERVVGVAGLGAEHRATVDRFYAEDRRLLKEQNFDRFTSDRAKDNVREYFAEAVESYLTVDMRDGQEFYKPHNNHEQLKERNPALFRYIDWIFHLDFPADVTLSPTEDPDAA